MLRASRTELVVLASPFSSDSHLVICRAVPLRLSKHDADTLRAWLDLTAVSQMAGIGLRMPHRPLRMMVLVYLTLQPDGVTTSKELRVVCHVGSKTKSLTNAIDSLKSAGLIVKIPGNTTRELGIRVTQAGSNVVGNFLRLRHPEPRQSI